MTDSLYVPPTQKLLRTSPLNDKLLTGGEIHKSDVKFSAVVSISLISIRLRF